MFPHVVRLHHCRGKQVECVADQRSVSRLWTGSSALEFLDVVGPVAKHPILPTAEMSGDTHGSSGSGLPRPVGGLNMSAFSLLTRSGLYLPPLRLSTSLPPKKRLSSSRSESITLAP